MGHASHRVQGGLEPRGHKNPEERYQHWSIEALVDTQYYGGGVQVFKMESIQHLRIHVKGTKTIAPHAVNQLEAKNIHKELRKKIQKERIPTKGVKPEEIIGWQVSNQ